MARVGDFPIGNVRHTGHIETLTRERTAGAAVLEVYAGWINVGLGSAGGNLVHVDFASFLPVPGTTVKQYPQEVDPTTGPASWVPKRSPTILEAQNLPTGGQPPRCLVLRGRFGCQHLFAHNMTHHVTLLWPAASPAPPIGLLPQLTPAGS